MKITIETDLNTEGSGFKIIPDEPIALDDIMVMLFNAQLLVLRTGAKDQSKEAAEALWDMYNVAASNTLSAFIPDKELRPDITQEALKEMLKAEDAFMKKAIKKVKRSK